MAKTAKAPWFARWGNVLTTPLLRVCVKLSAVLFVLAALHPSGQRAADGWSDGVPAHAQVAPDAGEQG